ncbi:MAG: nucleoside triphosphate pyrophosphohydrolase [Gammaproteobacteria bacterium]|nr:nucleoside triphosphate pyrophosphohydrolase [Gammaproteobacteria bacterium]
MKDWHRLLTIMAALRNPDAGCPWDCEQTHESLVRYTLEEAYEVADAIASGDMDELRDELGDLLFQVVFYARIAEESGDFTIEDVLAGICDKLTRRHPHVFADACFADSDEVSVAWEAIKSEERRARTGVADDASSLPHGALDGVAKALPALVRAGKLNSRAARVGFEWPSRAQALAKVDEELEELKAELEPSATPDSETSDSEATSRIEHEVGDLLLAVSNLARFSGIDPETALRKANQRFEDRFRGMEAIARRDGHAFADLGLDAQLALWARAKAGEG